MPVPTWLRAWRPRSRRARWLLGLPVALVVLLLALRLWPWGRPLDDVAGASTALFDRQGRLLRLTLAGDDRYRLPLALASGDRTVAGPAGQPVGSVSPLLVEALLLQEDRAFYVHPGVNPWALLRAVPGWLRGRPTTGGSTITMQLARLHWRLDTRTVAGKLRQIGLALWLEARHSKREILAGYLNALPMGANVEGAGAAALVRFGHPADRLGLNEALTLAVIPQVPGRGRAVEAAEPPGLVAARARLFARWRARHPEADARTALVPPRRRGPDSLPHGAPHFVQTELARHPEWQGHAVRTTLDARLQRALERGIGTYLRQQGGLGVHNACAVLVDTRDMAVRAWVGSADFGDAAILGENDGVTARRSPGSTLKPFLYALAFDQGLAHPETLLRDTPRRFGTFAPENFDGVFAGPLPAREALVRSRNVPAVGLAAELHHPSLHGFLREGGVAHLAPEEHYGLALALGGGEVTPEELVRLYALLSVAGDGRLRALRVVEPAAGAAAGAPSADDTDAPRLLSSEAAFMVREILAGTPRPAEATGARGGVGRVAWKTGTSWGFRDAWTAGLFGPYALVVWVGNFDGRGNPALVGLYRAAPLFFRLADAVTALAPAAEPVRPLPARLRRVRVCAASGELPDALCPATRLTWYIPGVSPMAVSRLHRAAVVDRRTGRLACAETPVALRQALVYEAWPSELARLFAQAGLPRQGPPPAGDCGATGGEGVAFVAAGAAPRIVSPAGRLTYALDLVRPDRARVTLLAHSEEPGVRRLYWFDGPAFIGESAPGAGLAWTPRQPGAHRLRVVDDAGRAAVRVVAVTLG